MKFLILLAGIEAVLGAVLDARYAFPCNQDNCYRALSRHSPSSDCSTFLASTTTIYSEIVTPSPLPTKVVTVTTVSTVYSIVGSGIVHKRHSEPSAFEKREAIPEAATLARRAAATPTIPAYASACSSSLAFATACTCLGYPGTTSTVTAPPIVTSTYTAIHEVYTATTTLAVCDPAHNYGLNYQGGYFPSDPSLNPGPYGYPINGNYGTYFYLNASTATLASLCTTCFQTKGCTGYSYVHYTSGQPDLYIVSTFSGQTHSPTGECPGGRETLLYDYAAAGEADGIGPCSDARLCEANNQNCFMQPT